MPIKLLTFYLLFSIKIFSQSHTNDIELVKKKEITTNYSYYKRLGNNQAIMETKQTSFIAKINPISNLMKATMFLYQNVISAQLSKECPYEITCSNFSKQSIKKFGLIKGIFISADRITRCNRISMLDINLQNINFGIVCSIFNPVSIS